MAGQLAESWARLTPEERGKLIMLMWSYAVGVMLIEAGAVACTAVSARRIWRLRSRGLVRATVAGTTWSGFAALTAATAVQRVVRRRLVARLPLRDGAR